MGLISRAQGIKPIFKNAPYKSKRSTVQATVTTRLQQHSKAGRKCLIRKKESSTNKGRSQLCCHSPPRQTTAKGDRLKPSPGCFVRCLYQSLSNQTQAMPKPLQIYSPPEQWDQRSSITLVGVHNFASPIHPQSKGKQKLADVDHG